MEYWGQQAEADAAAQLESPVSFTEKMRSRVLADFVAATQFLRSFHATCVERYQMYHNAQSYVDLKKKNEFPIPFFQEQMDNFVSYTMDKLFYKGRPCTIVAREDTDKGDAQAKQEMMDWQDYRDGMLGKVSRCLRDAAMYRVGIIQVDYTERSHREIIGKQQPVMGINEYGQQTPMAGLDGQPLMESMIEAQDVVTYRGPTAKRIDPLDFFITQEKREINDEHPVMIRSYHGLDYFKDNSHLFLPDAVTRLASEEESAGDKASRETPTFVDSNLFEKRKARGLDPEQTTSSRQYEYIEWQGWVDKAELYAFMGKPTSIPNETGGMESTVLPGEKEFVICGVVDQKTVVRLEDSPFDFKAPNVIVGVIQFDEDEFIGSSLGDKLHAVQKGLNILEGMDLANLRQTVNAGWVINKNAILNPTSAVVNQPGFVLEVNGPVDQAAKRLETERVAPDIKLKMDQYWSLGQRASGLKDILTGQGEKAAETLGESEIVAGQASLRLTDYIRTFEESFIQPLYEMRNQINMQFLDSEYVYGVIGKGAVEWRVVAPGQIRANVDFICESASRETNRLIITQQFIQMLKLSQPVAAMGFPVRVDRMAAQLFEQGLSQSHESVVSFFPSLKLEDAGVDVDSMLIQIMMNNLAMQGMMGAQGIPAGPPGQIQQPERPDGRLPQGGKEVPESRNNDEAMRSLNTSNRTQIGRNQE